MKKKNSLDPYRCATASADMVRMLFTYLEYRKIDPQKLEEVSGIDRRRMKQRIPVSTFNHLWRAARKAAVDFRNNWIKIF